MNEDQSVSQMPRTSGRRRAGTPLVAALLAVALAVLGVGAMFASAQTATPTPCPSATPGATPASGSACVVIDEYDIYFKPNTATIPADTDVTISITNHGATAHNFSITDHKNPGLKNLNISVDNNPGETKEVKINAPEGDYYFFCNVPGHEAAGMFGYISVKKDAKITSAEATVTPRAG
jgi:uncharacterized cupredoxin-like copper-binding protein